MTSRSSMVAAAFLTLASPVLMFPRIVGPMNVWVAVAVALAALFVSVRLLLGVDRVLAWCAGALSVAAVAGFVRSPLILDAASHFCGLALGLLTMATVAVWCGTRHRLAVGALLVLIGGFAVLGVGFRSVTPYGSKGVLGSAEAAPAAARALPLQSLHFRLDVNPNALAATAMLLLPIAVAVGVSPPRVGRLRQGLRTMGLLTGAAAFGIVVLMESRSTLLAAAVVVWVLSRRRLPPAAWWLSGLVVFVVAPAILVGLWSTSPQVAHGLKTLSARGDVWADALEGIRSSPWIGIGFDYFRHSGLSLWPYPPNLLVGAPHAHNIVLQTVLDIGLAGLAAYLAVIGVVARRALWVATQGDREEWVRYIGVGAALSLISVHVFGLLDAIPLGAKVGLFQWVSCGLILAAWRLRTPSEGT